jgi:hypothetical protein
MVHLRNVEKNQHKVKKYVKHIALITIIFILANVLSVSALEQDAGVKAVVKISGLQVLIDALLNLTVSIDNITTSQVIKLSKGSVITSNLTISGAILKKGSSVTVVGTSDRSYALKIKVSLRTGGWYLSEAEYDESILKPVPNTILMQLQVFTSITQFELFIPDFLIADEIVSVKIGDAEVTPYISKGKNGTYILFNSFVDLNSTPTLSVHIFKENNTLLKISGFITESNFAGITVEGIFKHISLKVLRGTGLLEVVLSTSVFKELPVSDKGILFKGLEVNIKPIVRVETSRELKIYIMDEFTRKLVSKPVKLSLYAELHKTWINLTSASANLSLVLPREPITIYVQAEGYEAKSVTIDENATQVSIYVKNLNPPFEERFYRWIQEAQIWIVRNWLILFSAGIAFLVALMLVRARGK